MNAADRSWPPPAGDPGACRTPGAALTRSTPIEINPESMKQIPVDGEVPTLAQVRARAVGRVDDDCP